MKTFLKIASASSLAVLVLSQSGAKIEAQYLSSSIATKLEVAGDNLINGALVCSRAEGFQVCGEEMSPAMYAVITENPAAYFDDEAEVNGVLVVQTGITEVQVSGSKGAIMKGDFVTSSEIPGVGVKATRNGYVLGTALDPFEPANPEDQGVVRVAIHIHLESGISDANSNLVAVLKSGLQAPIYEPINALRYLVAAMLVFVSFGLGFFYFGRMANTGVEAIGRNPLAQKSIQLSVLLHIFITFVVVIIGFGSAYLVLIL